MSQPVNKKEKVLLKMVIHPTTSRAHRNGITKLGAKVVGETRKSDTEMVLRFSTSKKNLPDVEKFYNEKGIKLEQYDAKERKS